MTTTAPAAPPGLRHISEVTPEVLAGIKLYRGVYARGNDLLDLDAAQPGVLNGSRILNSDLAGTTWPGLVRDLTIVDTDLRNAVWHLTLGEGIKIMGTTKIPISVSSDHQVTANLDRVRARVDNMVMTGHAPGLSLIRLAGENAHLGLNAGVMPGVAVDVPLSSDNAVWRGLYLPGGEICGDSEDHSMAGIVITPNAQGVGGTLGGRHTRIDAQGILAHGASIRWSAPGANMQKAGAAGATFRSVAVMPGVHLEESVLRAATVELGANLHGAFLDGSDRAKLTVADARAFTGADFGPDAIAEGQARHAKRIAGFAVDPHVKKAGLIVVEQRSIG